jgi:biotin synthase
MRPADGLRALAMFRFVHPDREIRVAGGREAVLGPMQALALYPANSLFTAGYLTTGGQGYAADRAMIESAGFEVAGFLA